MKKNQIINNHNCYDVLLNILKEYASIEDNFYVIDTITYKRLLYDNNINTFIEKLKPYYYESKLKYLEDCKTYNNFLTIIRQLCSYNNIIFVKKVFYNKSKYTPYYYINMNSIDIS